MLVGPVDVGCGTVVGITLLGHGLTKHQSVGLFVMATCRVLNHGAYPN